MSIAERIAPTLATRQANAAARDAARLVRDAFIVAQFAAMGARFDALLRSALGIDARIVLTVTSSTHAIEGRSFATLTVDEWAAHATFGTSVQTVRFTPRLDFRAVDQFGLIECALDFDFVPARSRADRVAQALVSDGVQLCGVAQAALLLPLDGTTTPLTAGHLEDAFGVWWLR